MTTVQCGIAAIKLYWCCKRTEINCMVPIKLLWYVPNMSKIILLRMLILTKISKLCALNKISQTPLSKTKYLLSLWTYLNYSTTQQFNLHFHTNITIFSALLFCFCVLYELKNRVEFCKQSVNRFQKQNICLWCCFISLFYRIFVILMT